MISAPSFWWRDRPTAAAVALWPISKLWGVSAARRMARPPRYRPPVPVICVGNFVVGGAGKTPTAIALAKIARRLGLRPGFVAPGYGGAETGPLIVDIERHSAKDVGDEPLLLAAVAVTAIGRDRAASSRLLQDQEVDMIIMDDGFQNPSLAKDTSFVCIDAGAGVGNGLVLPAGPLRAPLQYQLLRADTLVLIGDGERAESLIRVAARAGRPTLQARLKPLRIREWRNEPILAFAGIGRPAKFFESLETIGARLEETAAFPDHHRYTEADANRLLTEAGRNRLRLVTTEKDLVRLAGETGALATLRDQTEAFPVVLEFENRPAVEEIISAAIRAAVAAPETHRQT
ncbi:MAG: tetraacyldisaccharide 4'-kinase [Hyphomicrobiales bacterium]|nr:tetraacyldisaccharide 4'-kinase [Hyphomicrobiales bacterium]